MDKPTTLIIADDHPVFRKGLREIIEPHPEFQILGDAENGERALNMIEVLKPQVGVIDIEMPSMNGFELVEALRTRNILIEIIFLTMYKEQNVFEEAMDLGIKGYVLKESAIQDVLECLRIVASGKYYISPILSSYLVSLNDRAKAFHNRHPSTVLLTTTERKILRLIAQNKTSQEIANELFLSCRTVENHRMSIANKLNIHGHHNLLRFAIENRSCL